MQCAKMNKVAFYLDNERIVSVDCSDILSGNPGIGGTEYMIIVISYLLATRNNGLNVKTFTRKHGHFPDGYNYEVVGDFISAVNKAVEEGFDYFIFKHDASLIKSGVLNNIDSNIKLIVWDHVFVCYWELDYYDRNPNIFKIVYVGREMYDLYRDHRSFRKSCYIYNCIHLDGIPEKVYRHPFSKRKNVVVYVGGLLPYKGFHLLAEAWPKILSSVPDAELYVIGTGRLYDKNIEMGEYGLAERLYEKLFMQYLSKDGKILPGVHFMGNMGQDKNDILLQAKVGVPNPSGITETFCISAVEMQVMGALVTTINYPGFLDTVKNGILYHDRKCLAGNVIKLLKSDNLKYEETIKYFNDNMSYDSVASKWEKLLSGSTCKQDIALHNAFYRLKWLKECRRRLACVFPIIYRFPPIERALLFFERVRKGNVTYIDSKS